MKTIYSIVFIILISNFSLAQKPNESICEENIPVVGVQKNLSDDQLLELVQRQTFRYFWHYGHPKSGLARERSNTVKAYYYWDYINEAENVPNLSKKTFGEEACAIGGTGFGILSTVIAVERKWISREAAVNRLIKIVDFLNTADSFHGAYPHFMNGETGKTIPFGRKDDGADLVETSYLFMGLLTAKEYFNNDSEKEKYLRNRIENMWYDCEWNWFTNKSDILYWHWSPENDFGMNFPIWGYDEALITYIMAASSPYFSIDKKVYDKTWVQSNGWKNGKSYFGIKLPLGNYEMGGPLFFEQYTFMGINPNNLTDEFGTDYKEQVTNHTLINRQYCIENPKKFKGYSAKNWGLTAGDSFKGYVAHCPQDDRGVIQPTAALSSMPFTPKFSMEALRYFYEERGKDLWTDYGFVDGFSDEHNWVANSHLAIDQGPIIVMIENYRTGLIWNLFMKIPDVQNGLRKLGFNSKYIKNGK